MSKETTPTIAHEQWTIVELTEKVFDQQITRSQHRCVVLFYRPTGCPSCEQTKPIFEQFAKKHPEYKCFKYAISPKYDSVTERFHWAKLPVYYSFDRGKTIRGFSWPLDLARLEEIFISLNDLKGAVYDRIAQRTQIEAEVEVLNRNIEFFLWEHPRGKANETVVEEEETKAEEEFPLPEQTVDESTKKPCEACD